MSGAAAVIPGYGRTGAGAALRPVLCGLGEAVPPERRPQREITDAIAGAWGLRGAAAERFRRMSAATGIAARHTVAPLDRVVRYTTAQRMAAYERLAPPLAAAAAERALSAAGRSPRDVTDLIVVSCTGFAAPGLDVDLVDRLALAPSVRRTAIGFMGCYGAIIGLRTAAGACLSDPEAVALVVCLELCSLHLRDDTDMQNQVASALFADGAAASVVTGAAVTGGAPPLGRLSAGRSGLVGEGRGWMSWRVTDHGFRMTLSKQVPEALRRRVRGFVEADDRDAVAPTLVVHPGGPEILDAVDDALDLRGGRGLQASRAILRRYGNMSSATVLFVLAEALRSGLPTPMLMLSFGPGLAIEGLRIDEVARGGSHSDNAQV